MSWFSKEDDTMKLPEPVDPNAWEWLEDETDFNTWRRRVPGGWLVRTSESVYHGGGEALVFVPDPNHSWKA